MNESMTAEYNQLNTVPGIGPDVRDNLRACNITTLDELADCSKSDLMTVPGIGKNKANFLVSYLND